MNIAAQVRQPKVIGAAVVALVALFAIIYGFSDNNAPPEVAAQIWLYNTTSAEVSRAAKVGEIVPPEVHAHVFGCGSCSDVFVGYIETHPQGVDQPGSVSALPDIHWHAPDSEAAQQVRQSTGAICGVDDVIVCPPTVVAENIVPDVPRSR